ncbi:MAG: type II toxin-antitoxin system VapC family toxin [Acidobacteriota bacterium]
MRKPVYLDSTVLSYLFDERESLGTYVEVTKKWWAEERDSFALWISDETVAELSRGDYPNKARILECASGIQVLPSDERIVEIAQVYVNNFLMPRALAGDALHLAYASFYKLDFLLTWNCNHLANANKRQHIRIVNSRMNLFTPEIVTPLELFKETGYDH